VSALVGLSLSSAQSGRETKPFLPLITSFSPTRSGIEVGNQYFFHRQGGKSIFFLLLDPTRVVLSFVPTKREGVVGNKIFP
jgi:hypothetical protein